MLILKKSQMMPSPFGTCITEPCNVCACLFPLQAEKALLDVGEILVGSYRSIEVPLVNKSPCSVSFHLSVQEILLDEDPVYDSETVPSGTDLLSIHFTCDAEYLMYLIEPVLEIKCLLFGPISPTAGL